MPRSSSAFPLASGKESISAASVGEISSILQDLVPRGYKGGLPQTLERIMNPSLQRKDKLESLFSLAAFFASNNMLDTRLDASLDRMVNHGYAGALTRFIGIKTPTTCAFARALIEPAARLGNSQSSTRSSTAESGSAANSTT